MAARSSSTVAEETVISGVTVVNTRDGSLADAVDIFIDRSRIRRISKSDSVAPTEGLRTIDATGKYAVPGFLDMHTHAMFSHAASDFHQ
jgi:cytosine/adenosine deaminase-related metal-dependent hydrolase